MEREDVEKFVKETIESLDNNMENVVDFFELDSLQKLELIMECEKEYLISIEDLEVDDEWSIDQFIDFVYDKTLKKN